uniref:Uncharacterized protein LOC111108045 isoform X2 n=1 Tax=Crassostrea virginica TaxID=6565 RepID=A0A8B8B7X8_CRAVI|nr:uncharacterized protein LOC111108045 isoform X2 [Crassostrea virginica]
MVILCLIWLQLHIVAMTPISLEFNNTLTDCENGYIEIRCIIESALVKEIISVSLKRYNKSVLKGSRELAEFSKEGDILKDTELANRPGVSLSYLSIRIMGSEVKPLKDEGPYQCFLTAFDSNNGYMKANSTLKMLNISDNECPDRTTTKIQFTDIVSTVIHVKTQVTQPSKNTNLQDFKREHSKARCALLLG